MKKSSLLLWLTLVLVMSISSIYGQFAGGDGSEANPFQVETAEQLDNVRNYLSSWFIQTEDIDLGVAPWNQGEGWIAIGDDVNWFNGTYNGNFKSINNLYISKPNVWYQGLLGASQGIIKDLCVINASVTGSRATGSLVGYNLNGTVINCTSTGFITGTFWYTGGLVGWNHYGTIYNSISLCSVVSTGGPCVGGLVGENYDGGNIVNCFSKGHVSGVNLCNGGLVGQNYSNIVNCYSTGIVEANGAEFGGLVGRNNPSGTITLSYWDIEQSGMVTSSGGEGRSTDDMTFPYAANTFVDWDFSNIWFNDSDYIYNEGYPILQDQYFISRLSSMTHANFGSVFVEEQSTYQAIHITNTGTINIIISDVHFVATPLHFEFVNPFRDIVLSPGEADSIMVRFTPHTVGSITDTLFIVNNSTNLPILSIRLNGTGLYVLPKAPQNLNIAINGNDTHLSWDPVTQNLHDQEIVPDYYFIYISGDPIGSYTLMTLTPNLNYTHSYIGLGAERIFYRITAVEFYRNDLSAAELDSYLKKNITPGMTEADVRAFIEQIN